MQRDSIKWKMIGLDWNIRNVQQRRAHMGIIAVRVYLCGFPFDNLFWGPFLCLIIVFLELEYSTGNNNRVLHGSVWWNCGCVSVSASATKACSKYGVVCLNLKCNVEKCAHALFYLFLISIIACTSRWDAVVVVHWQHIPNGKASAETRLFGCLACHFSLFVQLTEPYLCCSCKIDMAYLSMQEMWKTGEKY